MKRLNPVRELERRTAAGEVAPIPAAGRWNGDRAGRAALAQLRLRARTPESDPVPRMLAEVRRVFVESAVCENPEALARMKAAGIILGHPKGVRNAKTKLSGKESLVRAMREAGASHSTIAKVCRVHPATISRFLRVR